jgi:hypothetical protein
MKSCAKQGLRMKKKESNPPTAPPFERQKALEGGEGGEKEKAFDVKKTMSIKLIDNNNGK